ncbi:MAG: Rv1355c family protein [Bacteroidota bacterium]
MITNKRASTTQAENKEIKDLYTPRAFRNGLETDTQQLKKLLAENKNLVIFNTLEQQLKELYQIEHPKTKYVIEEFKSWYDRRSNTLDWETYGVWFYYPWSNTLVLTLEEADFIQVRTARNKYKITQEEQEVLAKKTIGIVGLSVGKSVAMTLAMERGCGALRIADFDTLELHNLNRIRTGIKNIGLKKTVSVAREISEIDPYLRVTCFHEGITEENIDTFLKGDKKLDLLIEECDNVAVKVLARTKAKSLGIPVLMEASDRTTIDVERFDLEPERPLLHGRIPGLTYEKLKQIKDKEQAALALMPIVDLPNASTRLKASALEVGESITTWPQLASAVDTGAGICAHISRRILLNEFHESGRYQIDIDEIFSDKKEEKIEADYPKHQKTTLSKSEQESIIRLVPKTNVVSEIGLDDIKVIVKEAILAPSGGNSQPWQWYTKGQVLYVFIDHMETSPFADFDNIGSYASIGAAIENAEMKARSLGYLPNTKLFPLGERSPLVAKMTFPKSDQQPKSPFDHLLHFTTERRTDRGIHNGKTITSKEIKAFTDIMAGASKARLDILGDTDKIQQLSYIVGEAEKLRLMHPEGNNEFFRKELKWTAEEYEQAKAGIYIETLNFPEVLKAGMMLASDPEVTDLLNQWDKGNRFSDSWVFSSIGVPYMGMLSMPAYGQSTYVEGGRWMQRLWLKATELGLAFQPVHSPISFFARIDRSDAAILSENYRENIQSLKTKFKKLMPLQDSRSNILLFKLYKSDLTNPPKLRKGLDKVLCIE